MTHNVMTNVGKGAVLSLGFNNPVGSDGEYVISMVAYCTERNEHGISDSVMFVYDQPSTLPADALDYLPQPSWTNRDEHDTTRDYDIVGGYITSLHRHDNYLDQHDNIIVYGCDRKSPSYSRRIIY